MNLSDEPIDKNVYCACCRYEDWANCMSKSGPDYYCIDCVTGGAFGTVPNWHSISGVSMLTYCAECDNLHRKVDYLCDKCRA